MDDIKRALLGDHEAAQRLTDAGVLLMQGDCLELLKDIPDGSVDMVLTDPPYGISITDSGRLKKYNKNKRRWDDKTPPQEYFQQLFRVSKNQIIWGGNYFKLPPCRGFLIWDKQQPEDVSLRKARRQNP